MGARRGETTPDPADRDDRRGMRDGADRVPTIARWLNGKLPKSADVVELVLTARVGDEDEEILSRWQKSDVNESLAVEISALIQDYADDHGQHCKARLSWVTADGRPYMSKSFRGLCRKERQINVAPLDGTQSASLQGAQRHVEAILELTMRERMAADAARDREAARLERLINLFETSLTRAHERIVSLEERAEDLEETATEAVEAAEEAAEVAEAANEQAQENKDGERLATVVDLLAKQLTAGG